MHSPTRVPASPLAFLSEAYQTHGPSLFLITGSSGAGKTTWCRRVLHFARMQDWPVAGLLAPAVFADGRKVGIDLLDVRSNEVRRLAVHKHVVPPDGRATFYGVSTGDWIFDPDVLAWGNAVLAGVTRRDFAIIDELGPLEFRLGQGLQAGLALVDAWRYRLACVTLRPNLVGAARMRWPGSQMVVVGDADD